MPAPRAGMAAAWHPLGRAAEAETPARDLFPHPVVLSGSARAAARAPDLRVMPEWQTEDRLSFRDGSMKSHLAENLQIAHPRFHHSLGDGLYRPIAFLFVTPRMCDDILDEREMLLSAQPAALHERQHKLFAGYDPALSAEAFRQLLRLYGYPFANRR